MELTLSDLIIGRILPYLALTVGIGGLLLRLGLWLRIPVPFRITLYPVPDRPSGQISRLGRDLFLQTGLFQSSRRLWLAVWLFHISFFAVVAGHALGFLSPENPFRFLGVPNSVGRQLSLVLGNAAGLIMITTLAALLARRIFLPMARRYCQWRSYFEPLLLLVIAITGQLLRLGHNVPLLVSTRQYLAGLVGGPAAPLPLEPLFLAHYLTVLLLVGYLPFSRLVHLLGFFLYRMLLLEPPGVGYSPPKSRPSATGDDPDKASDSRNRS
ncbi:MAG: respiratory nitrate reductase subunit gamma [Syntrophotaleaceae bacterium]